MNQPAEAVVVGCGFPEGRQGDNVARIAAGLAGLFELCL